jgi:RND superfamily putative drug exporter
MRQQLSSALPETGQRPAPGPSGPKARAPVVEKIAGWSARHRKTAVFGWLVFVAVAVVGAQMLGTKNLQSYDPGQAGRAERVLDQPGVKNAPTESVLVQARAPGRTFAGDPEMHQAVRQLVTALRATPSAAKDVRSPLGPGGAALVSADRRSVLVTFSVAGDPDKAGTTVAVAQRSVAAVQARHPGLRVEEAGQASVGHAVNDSVSKDFRHAEATSVPITLILLVLVFGALIAAGIPVLLAITAVATSISLLAIPSRWLPIDSTTSSVVLLIGMAVGVDYSLFYLRREREEHAAGKGNAEALRIAAATSGRAIVVSGLTVMISLAGLFLSGIDVFSGLAVGAIVVVGISVLGSVTVLPAVLSWLGPWVDRARIPFVGRRRTAASRSRLWAGLVRRVVHRPVLWGGVVGVALLGLALPAFGMRTSDPGLHQLPADVPVVQSLIRVQQAFPGGPEPAEVVVTGRALDGPRMRRAITGLHARAAARGSLIREPITTTSAGNGRVLIVSVPLAGGGTDATSMRALSSLRDGVLPATLGHVGGTSYAVAGLTAGNHDFSAKLRSRTPIVFAFVLGLAFLVLLVAFRSVTIPVMAIALNLLSVGAAYGVMKLIFQDGHLQSLLGFTSYGGIVPWMPLFMFVLLFGLSMDYHVFILSRIREQWAWGASTVDAVSGGISGSAGVVTSAAAIMVAVFSIFATLSLITFKMFGIGMAVAVLIDATVIRGVLLPAAMTLLGDRCWYLPRWLGWLPGGRGLPA